MPTNKDLTLIDMSKYKHPNSSKYKIMAKELDDVCKICKTSNELAELLYTYLAMRYAKGLSVQQWRITLNMIQDVLPMGEDILIPRIKSAIIRSAWEPFTEDFYIESLNKIKYNNSKSAESVISDVSF